MGKPRYGQHSDKRAGAAEALEESKSLRTDVEDIARKHRHQNQIRHAEGAVEEDQSDEHKIDLVIPNEVQSLGHVLQHPTGGRRA